MLFAIAAILRESFGEAVNYGGGMWGGWVLGFVLVVFLRYMVMCVAVGVALNRTVVFAATRQQQLPGLSAWLLRATAVYALTGAAAAVARVYVDAYGDAFGIGPFLSDAPHDVLWRLFLCLCGLQFSEHFISSASHGLSHGHHALTLFEVAVVFAGQKSPPPPLVLVMALFACGDSIVLHVVEMAGTPRLRLPLTTAVAVAYLATVVRLVAAGTDSPPVMMLLWTGPSLVMSTLVVMCLALALLTMVLTRSTNLQALDLYNPDDPAALKWSDNFSAALQKCARLTMMLAAKINHSQHIQHISWPLHTFVDRNGYANHQEFDGSAVFVEHPEPSPAALLYDDPGTIAQALAPNSAIGRREVALVAAVLQAWDVATSVVAGRVPRVLLRQYPWMAEDAEQPVDLDLLDAGFVGEHYAAVLAAVLPEEDNGGDWEEFSSGGDDDEDADENESDVDPDVSLPLVLDSLAESQILLSHMNHSGPRLTRSMFRRASHAAPEATLAQVVGARRADALEGPMCVVCHLAAREVILWPCRCFAICDPCRVLLLMRDFDCCLCCRQPVRGYSRVYVP